MNDSTDAWFGVVAFEACSLEESVSSPFLKGERSSKHGQSILDGHDGHDGHEHKGTAESRQLFQTRTLGTAVIKRKKQHPWNLASR